MHVGNGQFVKGEHWRPRALHWDAIWLHEQYHIQGRSAGEIAAESGTTDAAIFYWLKKHGIGRRTISQARSLKYWGLMGSANPMHGKTGPANPRYVDGSSPDRQRMYVRGEGRQFIRDALARDAYQCRRCLAGKAGPKSLHVHHVATWAGNKDMRFILNNVVTLCRQCHSWVHSNANVKREFLA